MSLDVDAMPPSISNSGASHLGFILPATELESIGLDVSIYFDRLKSASLMVFQTKCNFISLHKFAQRQTNEWNSRELLPTHFLKIWTASQFKSCPREHSSVMMAGGILQNPNSRTILG
eukprot:jgi/Picsp_1/1130/NSC_04611-R1_---NA---